MRIRYNGTDAVDIPGANYVEHDDVVEVTDEVGATLLLAGCAIDDDGNITPADEPLWSEAKDAPMSPTGEEKLAAREAAESATKPLTRAEKKAAALAAAAEQSDPPATSSEESA